MPELKPGTYTLSRAVINPKPDRRQRYDWRKWERWEAGTRFIVEEDEITPSKSEAPVTVHMICRPGGSYALNTVSPLGALLAAHLVPIHEKPSDWLKRIHSGGSALGIIDVLFQAGKVTREDIENAHQAVLDSQRDSSGEQG